MLIELIIVACTMNTLYCIEIYTKTYDTLQSKCNSDKVRIIKKYQPKFPNFKIMGRCRYYVSRRNRNSY